MTQTPLERLRHHVSGAIERGEKEAIVEQTQKQTSRAKHQRGSRCVYRDMTARELDRAIDTNAELLAALTETLETLGDIADKLAHGSPMRNDLEAQCSAIRAAIAKSGRPLT